MATNCPPAADVSAKFSPDPRFIHLWSCKHIRSKTVKEGVLRRYDSRNTESYFFHDGALVDSTFCAPKAFATVKRHQPETRLGASSWHRFAGTNDLFSANGNGDPLSHQPQPNPAAPELQIDITPFFKYSISLKNAYISHDLSGSTAEHRPLITSTG